MSEKEKSQAELLSEKVLSDKKNAGLRMSEDQIAEQISSARATRRSLTLQRPSVKQLSRL